MWGFALLLFSGLSAFFTTPDLLFWSNRQLTWDDFRVIKKSNEGFDALIASGIQVSTRDSGGHISIELQSYVDPSESWVLSGSQTIQLLNHEQRHFDITEIGKRKLFFAIQTETTLNADNLNAVVDSLFEQKMQWQSETSSAYDKETKHGLNTVKQKIWDTKIDTILLT